MQEARAEAQRKAKDAEQAEWHRLQHERELGRHKARTRLHPLPLHPLPLKAVSIAHHALDGSTPDC